MNATNETERSDDARLRAVLARAYAVPPASDALQARLARLAVERAGARKQNLPAVRVRRALAMGLAVAGMAGVLIAAFVLGTVGTRVSEAHAALRRMAAAAARVNSAHWIEWRPTPNGPEHFRERWYQNGMLRQEDTSTARAYVFLQRDGAFYQYWRNQNKVIVTRGRGNEEAHKPALTLSDLLQSQEAIGLGDRIRALPDALVNGRPARRLQMDLPNSVPNTAPAFYSEPVPLRAIVYVDPQTDLPFRIETQAYREGDWNTVWLNDVRYNEPLPARLFAARFPGARFVDEQQEARTQWRQGLEQSAIRQSVGNRTVTLRAFDTTEVGDVFVWYTVSDSDGSNSSAGRDWELTITDDHNRRFERLGGGPVGRVLPELAPRYTFGGARLQADWFRPNGGAAPEWSRRWTVTVRLPEGTVELTPNRITIGGGALPKNEPYREFLLSQTRQVSAAARNRAEAFLDGRWKNDLPLVRAAQQGDLDIHKEALSWYRRAIDLESEAAQATGQRFDHARDYRKMAVLLRELGRDAEADQAERKAGFEAATP